MNSFADCINLYVFKVINSRRLSVVVKDEYEAGCVFILKLFELMRICDGDAVS